MIFQIRGNIMPIDGSHIGYSLFSSVCFDLWFTEVLAGGISSIVSM